MKIKRIFANNRKRCFILETSKQIYEYPYSELGFKSALKIQISSVYVDSELGKIGFSYTTSSGKQGSVLLDRVLSYNKDTDYILELLLHRLTAKSLEVLKNKSISKRELARKLKTSPKQLYRLLDPVYYGKTVDQMIKLLHALGVSVELSFQKIAA